MKDLNMYKEEIRRILTRLHGKIQYDILASVLGQLSDGRWQNSPRMEMYWRNASVVLDDGYDVVLEVKKHALPYCAMSDVEILQWFGKKIKQLIKEEFGNSRAVWSRTNTKQKTDWLSHKSPSQTSVSDCYFAYDTLMGRDTDNKVYRMESVFNKLMGKKVIKESLNDEQLKQAVTTIVNKTNLPKNVNKQQVIEDVYDLILGKDFENQQDLDEALTDYLKKTYGLANQSVIVDESVNDGDFEQAIQRAVYNFDWDCEYDDVDVIAQLECIFDPSKFRDEYQVEEAVTKYLNKHYREFACQSVKPSKKAVIREGIMEKLQNKFREAFENWTPQNGKNLDREDGINEYDEPYYCWEQEVWVALNDEGKIYVEANGQGFVSEFELDEAEVAKQCIDQCLYDLGYGDVNFESIKPSKKRKVIKESSFDNISWDHDAKPKTLDELIAKLQEARKELGNLEVGVQFRDEGGEYYGYDANLYLWYDKKTNTFVL